jgi:hypothetical protein
MVSARAPDPFLVVPFGACVFHIDVIRLRNTRLCTVMDGRPYIDIPRWTDIKHLPINSLCTKTTIICLCTPHALVVTENLKTLTHLDILHISATCLVKKLTKVRGGHPATSWGKLCGWGAFTARFGHRCTESIAYRAGLKRSAFPLA